jgi:GGDEF domain-containing protein
MQQSIPTEALNATAELRNPLTGLPNGRCLAKCWHDVTRAARAHRPTAVVRVDVEGERSFTESLGLADDVLQQLAIRLRHCCDSRELLFHTAPTCFTVVAPDIGEARLTRLTGQLRSETASWLPHTPPMHVRIAVSVLGGQLPASGRRSRELRRPMAAAV